MELKATTRNIQGKKVRFLRRQGIVPVHVIGHGIESVALQCEAAELKRTLSEAGKTRLIGLMVDQARKPRNVVVREIQKDPQTGTLLHVDFYQVRMAEKIKVDVPIALVGEAPALRIKGTMLIQDLNTMAIECLPDDIPASIELDLSPLEEADQAIYVKDIMLDEKISVLNDPDHIVAKISVSRAEKLEEVEEEAGEAEAVAEGEAEAPEEVESSEKQPEEE